MGLVILPDLAASLHPEIVGGNVLHARDHSALAGEWFAGVEQGKLHVRNGM